MWRSGLKDASSYVKHSCVKHVLRPAWPVGTPPAPSVFFTALPLHDDQNQPRIRLGSELRGAVALRCLPVANRQSVFLQGVDATDLSTLVDPINRLWLLGGVQLDGSYLGCDLVSDIDLASVALVSSKPPAKTKGVWSLMVPLLSLGEVFGGVDLASAHLMKNLGQGVRIAQFPSHQTASSCGAKPGCFLPGRHNPFRPGGLFRAAFSLARPGDVAGSGYAGGIAQ